MSSRPSQEPGASTVTLPGSLQLDLCPDPGVALGGLSDATIAMAEPSERTMDIQSLYAVAATAGAAPDPVWALVATWTGILCWSTGGRTGPGCPRSTSHGAIRFGQTQLRRQLRQLSAWPATDSTTSLPDPPGTSVTSGEGTCRAPWQSCCAGRDRAGQRRFERRERAEPRAAGPPGRRRAGHFRPGFGSLLAP
jgi:hypothetical protein